MSRNEPNETVSLFIVEEDISTRNNPKSRIVNRSSNFLDLVC